MSQRLSSPGATRVLRGAMMLAGWAAATFSSFALEPVNVRSQSGQFLVRGLPLGAPVTGYSTSVVQYLRLDPTLTTVSLERIKQAILGELGMKDQWRGLISITTHPVEEDATTVHVDSVRFKDGWGYRVEMPERIDKDRFMRVAVRVIRTDEESQIAQSVCRLLALTVGR